MRRAIAGILIALGCATSGCSSSGPPATGTTESDLTAAQCMYFAVDGKVTICHATGSTTNPVVVTSLAVQGCINGHAKHPHDSIAVNGQCGPTACLAAAAPCDATRACCDGLTCSAGTCQAVGCPPGQQRCGASCVDVGSDAANCGACGAACAAGGSCCAGACFDEDADFDHCGSCETSCAPPANQECAAAVCAGGDCGATYAPAGTAVADQTAGDCRQRQCDGGDGLADNPDDTDRPVDDNPCTDDVCIAGLPFNPPTAAGTACGDDGVCDGNGACVDCVTTLNCPAPANAECAAATCTGGDCGVAYTAAGTPVAAQTAGDCRVWTCDGSGSTALAIDDGDLPDDGNPCTADSCVAGVPTFTPLVAETSCGGSMVCDGAGTCVGCVTTSNCAPPVHGECAAAVCFDHACGFTFTAAGTAVAGQAAGDCHQNRCDGAGNIVNDVDDSDPPIDGLECTDDVCNAGAPSNPPIALGTSCGAGDFCDGDGACVDCLTDAHCPAPADGECAAAACQGHVCGYDPVAAGTDVAAQPAGDCHTVECDGAGGRRNVVDDGDRPDDSNPCTDDVCTAGAPSNPPAAIGADCGDGMQCDGGGSCVTCLDAASCPVPTEPECAAAACTGGDCGFTYQPFNTTLPVQTAGDCIRRACDGAGNVLDVTQASDVPPSDNNPCTVETCVGHIPSFGSSPAGTSCGGNQVCNGSGTCVGCLVASSCPPPANPQCAAATCTGNSCGFSNQPNGTACGAGVCTNGLCCTPSGPRSRSNLAKISFPAGSGVPSPYPSAINVSGIPGSITKVTVSLNSITESFPDDFDILLVGPSGQSVILMSDTGGSHSTFNLLLTFDSTVAASLPDSGQLVEGTFKPTNFGAGDTFAAPAPAGPYGSTLAVFNGTNPNGAWRLFVVDDSGSGFGHIDNGYTIRITTDAAVCQ